MKYRGYLFDWDGTLGDSLPMWFSTYQETFKLLGKEVDYLTIGLKVIGDWEAPKNMGVDPAEFYRLTEAKLAEDLDWVRLNEGGLEMVKKIKNDGGVIGLLTASKRYYVEGSLKNTELVDWVDVFLGKEDVKKHKPDPEIILKAMKILGLSPNETVMIGDSMKDIEAANRAGIESVLYYPKRYVEFYGNHRNMEFKPEKVIENLRDLDN